MTKGFNFDQFPPDLRPIAEARWPNGPGFTLCSPAYFGETGYVAVLREELDQKEFFDYMAANKGTTGLARQIELNRDLILALRREVEIARKMQYAVHELVKFATCDQDEEDEEDEE